MTRDSGRSFADAAAIGQSGTFPRGRRPTGLYSFAQATRLCGLREMKAVDLCGVVADRAQY
jgi:hypothetical protein